MTDRRRGARPTPANDLPVRRIDRLLAFMSLGLAVVSIGCFVATLISLGAGVAQTGVWLFVSTFPLFALPIAFLMMIALLIMTFVRRSRANRPG